MNDNHAASPSALLPPLPVSSRVLRVLEGFMSDLEHGKSPDPEAVIAAHPELAEPLRTFLASLEFLQGAARNLPSQPNGIQTPPARADSDVDSLLGDFRLIREIGRGGMGVVYEAEQVSLARRVALKVLPFAGVLDPRQLQRFKNESRAAAGLHHPHIVPVYAVGSERGVHFYAMQFIEGRTLAQVIHELAELQKEEGRDQKPRFGHHKSKSIQAIDRELPESDAKTVACDRLEKAPAAPEQMAAPQASTVAFAALSTRDAAHRKAFYRAVAKMGIQVAQALDHAHSLGITHRDIKPSNLIVDSRGEVWVTDFGLAQMEADVSITHAGELVGTLQYMSPEQATGERGVLDHRTDIYSLGLTLYELLVLRRAHSASNAAAMLRKVFDEAPAPLRSLVESVPKDLETIVHKAMSKDAADRYRSANDLAIDLQRFLDDRPPLARRPTAIHYFARWTRRHTGAVWTALAAMIVVTVASIAAALLFNAERKEKEREQKKVAVKNAELRKEQGRVRAAATREYQRRIDLAAELYNSEIYQAAQAQFRGDPRSAAELLSRSLPGRRRGVPDRRGFEWRLLNHISAPKLEIARASERELYCLAVSNDGKLLVAAGQDALLRGYDAETLAPLFQIPTGQIEVNHIAFSPDGGLLATAGDDGTVKTWRLATQAPVASIDAHPEKAFQAIFHPDGQSLITSGNEPIVRQWRIETGELLREFNAGEIVNDIDLSPEGGWLAVAIDKAQALLWRLSDSAPLGPVPLQRTGSAVAFSADGRWVAIGDKVGHIQVFTVPDANGALQLVRQLLHREQINALAFSPDGQRMAVSDRGGVAGVYQVLAAAPESPPPATIEDDRAHALSRWQAHSGRAYDMAWVGDEGALASVGQDGALRKWTPPSARIVRLISKPGEDVLSLVRAPEEGRFAAIVESPSRERRVVWIDAIEGEKDSVSFAGQYPQRLALADNGSTFAAISHDGKLLYLGDREGMKDPIDAPPTGYDALCFSHQSPRLFAFPFEGPGPIAVIDADTGSRLGETITAPKSAKAAIRHLGQLLAMNTGSNNDLEIWRLQFQDKTHTLRGHASSITDLEFSPDYRFLASVSGDRTLRTWNLEESNPLGTIIGHATKPLLRVAFSSDGDTIATADEAGEIRLWSAEHPRELLQIPKDPSVVRELTFSANGRYLAWADDHGLWVADAGESERNHNRPPSSLVADNPSTRGNAIGVAVDCHDSVLKIFDPESDRVIGAVELPTDGIAIDAMISLDATRAFVSMGPGKKIVEVDLYAFEPIGEPIALAARANGLAMTPDGRFLLATGAIGADDPVSVVDTQTRRVTSFACGSPNAAAVNASGEIVLADAKANVLRKAKMAPDGAVTSSNETIDLPGASHVVLVADGKTGLAIGGNLVCSFAMSPFRLVKSTSDHRVNSVAISDSNDRLNFRNETEVHCNRWTSATGDWGEDRAVWLMSSFPLAVSLAGVNRLAVSPDGAKVYVPRDDALSVLDSATSRPLAGGNFTGFLLGIDIRRPQQGTAGDAPLSR